MRHNLEGGYVRFHPAWVPTAFGHRSDLGQCQVLNKTHGEGNKETFFKVGIENIHCLNLQGPVSLGIQHLLLPLLSGGSIYVFWQFLEIEFTLICPMDCSLEFLQDSVYCGANIILWKYHLVMKFDTYIDHLFPIGIEHMVIEELCSGSKGGCLCTWGNFVKDRPQCL